MHETLKLVIYFPYLNRCPWYLKKTKIFMGFVCYLQIVFKEDYPLVGCVLSQLYKQTCGIYTVTFGQLYNLLSCGVNSTLLSQ